MFIASPVINVLMASGLRNLAGAAAVLVAFGVGVAYALLGVIMVANR